VCTNTKPREDFLFSRLSIPALEITEIPNKSVLRLPYLRVTRSGPEADHLHPSIADIKANGTVHQLHMPSTHAQRKLRLYIYIYIYIYTFVRLIMVSVNGTIIILIILWVECDK